MFLKKMWLKVGRFRPLLAAAAILMLSTVLTLGMKNGSRYYTGIYDDYSQQLVFGRMHQMQQGQSGPGGFLGTYPDVDGESVSRRYFLEDTPVQPENYLSYSHQSGLQGWVLGKWNLLFRHFGADGITRENWLYNGNSILFYAVNFCIAWALLREAGLLPALVWMLSLLLSPWPQRGMKDLYWCLWLWLLPCAAGIFFCARIRKNRKAAWWPYLLIGVSCLIRCLCGFEFVSTILILMEIPLVYCFLQKGADRWLWLKRMWWAGVSGVGGVAAALAAWVLQGWLYFGSAKEGLRNVLDAAGNRMSVSDAQIKPDTTVTSVLYKYLVGEKTVILRCGPMQVTPLALLFATLLVICVGCAVFAATGKREEFGWLLPWLAAWVLSFAAPVSWMVLSKAHSDIHTHLIPMLWSFAFVPASCTLVTVILCRMAKSAWNHSKSNKD